MLLPNTHRQEDVTETSSFYLYTPTHSNWLWIKDLWSVIEQNVIAYIKILLSSSLTFFYSLIFHKTPVFPVYAFVLSSLVYSPVLFKRKSFFSHLLFSPLGLSMSSFIFAYFLPLLSSLPITVLTYLYC